MKNIDINNYVCGVIINDAWGTTPGTPILKIVLLEKYGIKKDWVLLCQNWIFGKMYR